MQEPNTPKNDKADEQAAKRRAARVKKKQRMARKKARESRGVRVSVPAPAAGTKVTVSVVVEATAAHPVPAPEEIISDVKREVLRFENSPYAMAYNRPLSPWAAAARRGCRRI